MLIFPDQSILCRRSDDDGASNEFFISFIPFKKAMIIKQRWKNSTIIPMLWLK